MRFRCRGRSTTGCGWRRSEPGTVVVRQLSGGRRRSGRRPPNTRRTTRPNTPMPARIQPNTRMSVLVCAKSARARPITTRPTLATSCMRPPCRPIRDPARSVPFSGDGDLPASDTMTGMDRITPTARVRAVLGGAYGAAVRASGVGTEHLLVALADRDAGPAGEVLDEYQVTPVVAT